MVSKQLPPFKTSLMANKAQNSLLSYMWHSDAPIPGNFHTVKQQNQNKLQFPNNK